MLANDLFCHQNVKLFLESIMQATLEDFASTIKFNFRVTINLRIADCDLV